MHSKISQILLGAAIACTGLHVCLAQTAWGVRLGCGCKGANARSGEAAS
jgi:hypothetical protein